MPFRRVSITAITLLFFGTLIWTFTYGPSKRRYIIPDRTVTVHTAAELDALWHSAGAHGRIAVLFARYLPKKSDGFFFPEIDYLDIAMNHGIVRTAYYVVPDRAWVEAVADNLANPSLIVQPKITDTGYMLLHEGGRIHVVPLSKFIPEQEQEKALVVIDPALWTEQEQSRINGFIRSGQLTTDLVVVINAAKRDLSSASSVPQLL